MKLHLGEASSEVDRTLIQNIIQAQRRIAIFIDGKTFSEIAAVETTSKRRVQDVVDLPILVSEIRDAIASGE